MAPAQYALVDGTYRETPGASQHDLSYEMQRMSARQIWLVLRRHLRLIITLVTVCVVVVLFTQLKLPETFEATATVQVELNDANGSNQADTARNQQRVANEARIYRSQALAEQVVKDMDLVNNSAFTNGARMTPQQATARLLTRTRVSSANDSDFIDIIVRSRSPELAARIANQFVESLQKLRSTRRQQWRDGVTRALAAESVRLAAEVEKSERAVADFRRAHGMPIGAGSAEDYQQMNRIAVEQASASAMNAAAAARSASVSSASHMRTAAGASSPVLDHLQRGYDDLLRERSQLSVSLGTAHPDRQRIEAQIAQARTDLDRERASVIAAEQAKNNADARREQQLAAGEASAAAARAGQLKSQLSSLSAQAFRNNANNVDLAVLDRRAEVARQAYLTTAQRAQAVRSELETTGVNSSVVSAATAPLVAIAPAPKKMALAAFVGSLLLSLLIVFCIEMFDNRLRSGEQLHRLFGLRTFAMLPHLARDIPMTTLENPVLTEPQSLFAEVARTLASEVDELGQGRKNHTVLVTSPLPGDGKSSVALTLAVAAVSMGRSAIVVDFDLRRPGPSILRTIQASSGTPDLIELLTGDEDPQHLLPSQDADVTEKTAVVLSTSESVRNPGSLIRGWQVVRLLERLRDQYDLVVINAPAILAVRDATTLSGIADSTLMVVHWGKTTIEQLRAAMKLLHTPVAGAVFNQVDYAEHARRGYGDAVQFYMGSASYYSDSFREPRGWIAGVGDRVRGVFKRGNA
jgi:uncharacterized protein involved in exopolysaccharide biosynthesis/Mrp family chromosome partitioning ATPase